MFPVKERVYIHFFHIIFSSSKGFRVEKQCKLRGGSRMKHQHGDSNEEKFLVGLGSSDESMWCREQEKYALCFSNSKV
jgi:hypothetical protein